MGCAFCDDIGIAVYLTRNGETRGACTTCNRVDGWEPLTPRGSSAEGLGEVSRRRYAAARRSASASCNQWDRFKDAAKDGETHTVLGERVPDCWRTPE